MNEIEVAIRFDPATGKLAVTSQVPAAITLALLEAAKTSLVPEAMRELKSGAAPVIALPNPEQVRALAPAG